jgi:hypothetical protein
MRYKHSLPLRVVIWTLAVLLAPVVWLGERLIADNAEPGDWGDL